MCDVKSELRGALPGRRPILDDLGLLLGRKLIAPAQRVRHRRRHEERLVVDVVELRGQRRSGLAPPCPDPLEDRRPATARGHHDAARKRLADTRSTAALGRLAGMPEPALAGGGLLARCPCPALLLVPGLAHDQPVERKLLSHRSRPS
jgi:hypothetical protein